MTAPRARVYCDECHGSHLEPACPSARVLATRRARALRDRMLFEQAAPTDTPLATLIERDRAAAES